MLACSALPANAQQRAATAAPPAAAQAAAPAPDSSKNLETRAKAYWEVRQKRDLAAMYEFYSSIFRAKVSRDAFIKQMQGAPVDLPNARVTTVRVLENRAMVTVMYRTLAPTVQEQWVDSQTEEPWVREADGIWRKAEEPLALPPTPGGLGGPNGPNGPNMPAPVNAPPFPTTPDAPSFGPPKLAVPAPPRDR